MSALRLLLATAICASPALGWAEPRFTDPSTLAAPAPEAIWMPAASTPAAGVSSDVAGPSTRPAGVQATPVVAPALPLVEAPPAGARSEGGQLGWAAGRLAVAFTVVGVLLVGGLKLYRRSLQPGPRTARRRSSSWLARWVPASAGDQDKITLLARNYLGTRESVCVLRVGTERFLVGVTSAQISMLGRLGVGPAAEGPSHLLDSLGSPAAAPRTISGFDWLGSPAAAPRTSTLRAAPDFSESLMAAASARDGGGDVELRQALARSRARLAEIVSGRGSGA